MSEIKKENAFVDADTCIGCGACEAVCPTGAIKINDEGKAYSNETCIACGACVSSCPVSCIQIKECTFKK